MYGLVEVLALHERDLELPLPERGLRACGVPALVHGFELLRELLRLLSVCLQEALAAQVDGEHDGLAALHLQQEVSVFLDGDLQLPDIAGDGALCALDRLRLVKPEKDVAQVVLELPPLLFGLLEACVLVSCLQVKICQSSLLDGLLCNWSQTCNGSTHIHQN